MSKHKIFLMPFAQLYPLYLNKALKKGRSQDEVDQIIFWLTGYDHCSLAKQIKENISLEDFFNSAPRFNPNASLITGAICGVKVEEITNKTMQRIRYLDKLIDELAKGKSLDKILR